MANIHSKWRQFRLINLTEIPLEVKLGNWQPTLVPLKVDESTGTMDLPFITFLSDGTTLQQEIENLPSCDGAKLFFVPDDVAQVARKQGRYDVVGVRDGTRPLVLRFEGSRPCGFSTPKPRSEFHIWPYSSEERRWEEPLVTGNLIDSYLSQPQKNVIYLAPEWVVKHACLLGRDDYLAIV